MTEYWVSQGNKWCDFCKIYIANNPASIRTHEFGQCHKKNVAKKLADIRKENASKEKEKQQALKDLERIEAQARRSYQKDLAAEERIVASASAPTAAVQAPYVPLAPSSLRSGSSDEGSNGEWVFDQTSGYFYNATTGYYHDPSSGLYYNEHLGKWTAQEEAFRESVVGAHMPEQKVFVVTEESLLGAREKAASSTRLPGPVLQASKLKAVSSKGVASSLEVGKRKRQEKSKSLSKDEVAALKAREAAKKRIQEREKGLLGLYH